MYGWLQPSRGPATTQLAPPCPIPTSFALGRDLRPWGLRRYILGHGLHLVAGCIAGSCTQGRSSFRRDARHLVLGFQPQTRSLLLHTTCRFSQLLAQFVAFSGGDCNATKLDASSSGKAHLKILLHLFKPWHHMRRLAGLHSQLLALRQIFLILPPRLLQFKDKLNNLFHSTAHAHSIRSVRQHGGCYFRCRST